MPNWTKLCSHSKYEKLTFDYWFEPWTIRKKKTQIKFDEKFENSASNSPVSGRSCHVDWHLLQIQNITNLSLTTALNPYITSWVPIYTWIWIHYFSSVILILFLCYFECCFLLFNQNVPPFHYVCLSSSSVN